MSEENKHPSAEPETAPAQETPKEQQARRPLTQKEREIRQRQRDLEFLKRKQMIREAADQEGRERVYNSIHYHHVEQKPDTFAKKWENYWYHYKFTTIVVIIIIGLVSWFIHDLVTNTKYDLDIGLLSYETYWNDYTELAKNWTPYLDDNTGDGEVNISVMDVEYNMDEGQKDQSSISYEEIMADTTHMSVIFLKGSTYFVLIMDQNYYDYFTDIGVKFADLSTLVDNDAVEGDKYYLSDDPDFADFGGKDDCFLVLRDTSTINGWDKADDDLKEQYEVSKQFLIDLINKNVHETANEAE